jgi:hypothetical protein
MENQKINEGPAPGTRVLVSSKENQFLTVDMFDQSRAKSALMVASTFAASSLIPEHYQQRPENVLVAMYRSARLGMDLFSYMETTYCVHGRLGHESKFVVSLINTSGKFKTPLMYEMSGEIKRDQNGSLSKASTRICKAWAILKETGDKISQDIGIDMAFLEGWATKPGPDKTLKSNKWQTMPDIMLQYRAAAFFGRMYCPELVMGLNTKDELDDIQDAEAIDVTETGKDIFEKGVEVSTAAEPVLDPAMEVKVTPEATTAGNGPSGQATVPEPQRVAEPVDVAAVPPAASPIAQKTPTPQPVEIKYLPLTADEAAGEPPVEPVSFKLFLLRKFTAEQKDLDVFLLSKKYLGMGETASDLSDSYLKILRERWVKFLAAYEAFKTSRKVGAA